MRRSLGAVTALIMLATATNAAVAATPADLELDDAIRLRKDFGLQGDRAFVRTTFIDTAKYGDMSWGVPLTKSEVEDLNRRVQRVGAVRPAVEAAEGRDGYAGVYHDQLRGGMPVFLFSKNRAAAAAQVRRIIDGATAVEVKKVDRSMKQLETVKKDVLDERDRLRREDVLITAVGFDIPRNVVEVGVESKVAKAKTLLEDYGDAVRVVQEQVAEWDVCEGANHCPTAKGGIRLNGSEGYCTAGFVGMRTDGPDHLVLMTAGHCFSFAQSGGSTVWKHSGATVGWSEKRIWSSSGSPPYPTLKTDFGIIDLKASFEPGTFNKLLMTNSNPIVGRVDAWAYSLGQQFHGVGTPLCRMGAGSANKSGYPARKCGTVDRYRVTKLSCRGPGTAEPCAWIENVMRVSFDSTAGDSGGPYWMGNAQTNPPVLALGTHVHSGNDNNQNPKGWYTPISVALGNLLVLKGASVFICLNLDC